MKTAIGEYVRLRGVEFRVVGVFGPEQIKPWTEDDMEAAVIPLTTMPSHLWWWQIASTILFALLLPISGLVKWNPKSKIYLKNAIMWPPLIRGGIGGFNLEEEFRSVQTVFKGIKFFLWFVGIGTLLAGVVGVSNIMLIVVKGKD